MSDHERPSQRLTDDDRIQRGIADWQERGWSGVVDDVTARIIANQHHGGQTSELYSFLSTGRIDLAGLQAEVFRSYAEAELSGDEKTKGDLDALALYLLEKGDREPVPGWAEATKWGDQVDAIKDRFEGVPDDFLIARLEHGSRFSLHEEEAELTRRLATQGKRWIKDGEFVRVVPLEDGK